MSQPAEPRSPRDQAVMSVLTAMRAFTDALDHMNGGMKGDMDMNATDLAALRMLIVREHRGESVSPHDVARHLRISSASTTKLLDRLSAAGHVQRHPHPHDRRARVVVLAEESRLTFARHFGARMRSMRDALDPYTEEELSVIARFLDDMSGAIGED